MRHSWMVTQLWSLQGIQAFEWSWKVQGWRWEKYFSQSESTYFWLFTWQQSKTFSPLAMLYACYMYICALVASLSWLDLEFCYWFHWFMNLAFKIFMWKLEIYDIYIINNRIFTWKYKHLGEMLFFLIIAFLRILLTHSSHPCIIFLPTEVLDVWQLFYLPLPSLLLSMSAHTYLL